MRGIYAVKQHIVSQEPGTRRIVGYAKVKILVRNKWVKKWNRIESPRRGGFGKTRGLLYPTCLGAWRAVIEEERSSGE